MAKITAPNREYTGVLGGGVAFANGVGYTSDPHIVDWLARKGYGVELEEGDSEEVRNVIDNVLKGLVKAGEIDPAAVDEASFTHRVGRPIEDAAVTVGLDDKTRSQIAGPGAGKLLPPVSAPMMAPGSEQGMGTVIDSEEAAKALLESRGYEVTATGLEGQKEAEEGAAKAAKSPAKKTTTAKKTSAAPSKARKRTQKGGGTGK